MMQDRIKLLLEHLGISPADFAGRLGVQRSAVSHIVSGRNNPGLEFLQKILKGFPEISPDWLILGKGTITRDDSGIIADPKEPPRTLFEHEFRKSVPALTEFVPEAVAEKLPPPKNENREPERSPVEQIVVFYKNGTFKSYGPAGEGL